MPTCRYVEENGLAAKRSAGVAPEVNLGECVTCMPPPSTDKAATLALKPRVQNRGISCLTKGHVLQFFLKQTYYVLTGC